MPFTDDFNRADEDLETSANWTRVDGVAGALAIRTNVVAAISATQSLYQCPDQGSANHYTQNVLKYTSVGAGKEIFELICRGTTGGQWGVGFRKSGSNYQIYSRGAVGGFTLLGTASSNAQATGDIQYLEVDSDDNFDFRINGTSKISGASSTDPNPTETRQGMLARGNTQNPLIDDFEAGVLAAPGFPDELLVRQFDPTQLRM